MDRRGAEVPPDDDDDDMMGDDDEYTVEASVEAILHDIGEIQEVINQSIYPSLEDMQRDLAYAPDLQSRVKPWLRRFENLSDKLDDCIEEMREVALTHSTEEEVECIVEELDRQED